jgi:hypothetical protein
MPLTNWIRILLFSSLTFKMPTKTDYFQRFSAYFFLRVHLYYFSKIKIQNSRNHGFAYYFCLTIEGSGSVPMNNGSGSRRQKKTIRIRIRNTDMYLAVSTMCGAPLWKEGHERSPPLCHCVLNSTVRTEQSPLAGRYLVKRAISHVGIMDTVSIRGISVMPSNKRQELSRFFLKKYI